MLFTLLFLLLYFLFEPTALKIKNDKVYRYL
jgi:hypothetical protein